nr:MAG TPA: Regulatory protein-modification, helix-turn-helix, transcriptional regulato, DNA [Caudoviricetes sp.]
MNKNQPERRKKLTDSKKLSDEINESGITITAIAKKIGITREGFYKKLNNETEFKASEISTLQKILMLSNKKRDDIFFAKQVEQ